MEVIDFQEPFMLFSGNRSVAGMHKSDLEKG